MRVSLKAKLTGLISLLVLLVVLATSTLYVSSLTRKALAEIESKGQYMANEIYHHARKVLAESRMPAGEDPANPNALRRFVQSRLASDTSLTAQLESAVADSPTAYYVTITDSDLHVLVHDDPEETGRPFVPAPPFVNLVRAGLYRQLRVIYGPPHVYEIVYPLEMAGKPIGDVRVGLSTVFLRDQITPELRAALVLSGVMVLLATITSGLLSFLVLRPLETISRGVDRLTRGEYTEPLELNRTDEWGILSSKLNLLGEQIRGEKAAFVQLKENFNQLVSKLTDGLLLFDQQDRLVLATPAGAGFLGRDPDTLSRRHVDEIFSSDGTLDELVRKAFRSRKSVPWQSIEPAPGSEAPRIAVNVQIVEERGDRVASLVTLRDATTRAQLQDQIDLSAKLAALGRLTAGVAHEVKNPLNAMVLQLEVLKLKLVDQDDRVHPQLESLTAEIRRLDRVVKTFLDFTRPVELHPTETQIESLVRELFTLAEPEARRNNVSLVFEPDGHLPTIRVDRDLIKQALLNLILNGCQAMPSGGELRVRPYATPEHVGLEIADQGMGIPPEAREKIFSLYFTTKPGGTGVGLAMAFRIVQLHNGSIEFTSEVDRGTTFRVCLPRSHRPASAS